MWEFDEAVEVRSDVVDGVETPAQFLWRGRLWRVCSVQAHWTETAAWWERGIIGAGLGASYDARHSSTRAHVNGVAAPASPRSRTECVAAHAPDDVAGIAGSPAAVGVLDADWGPRRAVYRVEAGCGRHGRRELFDLAHDPDSGRWQLERVTDR
ncbi:MULTISPECIES: DUF6504 family protein [unclassified Kribbella]|uniref:DUF6504 family protein n=1 Tax=unclassified Kribbella TaxID=2644121 RepID=UPI0030191ABA